MSRSQSEFSLHNPLICEENMAKFKDFLNQIKYDGPIVASTDSTKLTSKLRYHPKLECILGSILPLSETKVSSFENIDDIVNKVKITNSIAKNVRVYILQVPLPKVPPFILGIIPNNYEKSDEIVELHHSVLNLAAKFNIHILSIGADGAAPEFKAQKCIMQTSTSSRLEFSDELYGN